MKPVRVYFVCLFLRELYYLKVFLFQSMEIRGVFILKLMGMYGDPYYRLIRHVTLKIPPKYQQRKFYMFVYPHVTIRLSKKYIKYFTTLYYFF
uniref:Phage putative head morphogenesis protein, SPP1 gp7 n=1 Tax=Bacillus thuringiensis serovar tenebrionis str. YBT-1765 TaxID=529121 RepID=V9TRR9_BACTT|nr:Phage putative head morphogenesis protein, SPP1 gp7 [Bacillus thuringiensis serovar tenebrionis str. YBT-1765]